VKKIQPLIEPGLYEMQFIKHETRFLYGARKLSLHFKIIESGSHCGQILWLNCEMPTDGKLKTGSKLFRLLCLANGGQRPDRFDRISTKVFRGKVFKGKVVTVTKDWQQQPIPTAAQYSVILTLIEKLTL